MKERFKEITELTDETNIGNLIYCYKNMSQKIFNDFNNVIKYFLKKIEDGAIRLEGAKNQK